MLLWRERTVSTSVLFEKVLRKRLFGGLSPIWCCPEKWSWLNRISHPHRVKICVDHNGQINLRAKHMKFFLLYIYTKMAVKVDEPCCLCYIKIKNRNETTRILISFKWEVLMAAWDEISLVLWVIIEAQL